MRAALLWSLGIVVFVATVKFVGFSHGNSCEETARLAKEQIQANRSCSADSECTKLRLTCPFDCDIAVRSDAASEIVAAVNSYNRGCMMVCPDCPKEDHSVTAKCIAGSCSLG